MKRQLWSGLILVVALLFALGCQIAELFSATSTTAVPTQPPVVLNTTVPPTAVPQPTAVPTVVVLPQPTQAIALPTLVPLSQPTQAIALPTLAPLSQPTQPPASQPAAPLPAGCTNPNTTISSLVDNGAVSGLVEIRGTATRPDMQYWKVEYRSDASTAYITLNNSDKPVTDDVLARLSTKTVPNGVYYIRLVIVLKDGNFSTPCEFRVSIAN